jgi:hypothetical protein
MQAKRPPAPARKLSLGDELLLSFQLIDEALSLSLTFQCQVKSFDTSATNKPCASDLLISKQRFCASLLTSSNTVSELESLMRLKIHTLGT